MNKIWNTKIEQKKHIHTQTNPIRCSILLITTHLHTKKQRSLDRSCDRISFYADLLAKYLSDKDHINYKIYLLHLNDVIKLCSIHLLMQ